jgi:hypothetical protein
LKSIIENLLILGLEQHGEYRSYIQVCYVLLFLEHRDQTAVYNGEQGEVIKIN